MSGGRLARGKACPLPGGSPQETNNEGTGKRWGRGSQEDPQISFPERAPKHGQEREPSGGQRHPLTEDPTVIDLPPQ